MTEHKSTSKLVVRPVGSDTWEDFDKLFSAKGSPKHCWCMAWRADPKDPKSGSGAGRKSLMKDLVSKGVPVGLLGYVEGEPVAWCSIAPFDTFHGLRKNAEDTEKIWSVTCFFIRREYRGLGLSGQLLAAAVGLARKHRAKLVEGYGVAPTSPSYRHMGFVSLFEEGGFKEVAREGTRRHVMQLPTRRSRSAA